MRPPSRHVAARAAGLAACLVTACLLTAACGPSVDVDARPGATSGDTAPEDTATYRPATTAPEAPPQFETPPPVRLTAGDRTFDLRPWTFCYRYGCADGMPPADPPDVGATDSVAIEFPLEGWTFEATFEPAGQPCGRAYPRSATSTGPTTSELAPAGPAGSYDVTLFGRGGPDASDGGDLFVTFRWSTTTAGPVPSPEATISLLADHDGRVDSYGVALNARHVAGTPAVTAAQVVVIAADDTTTTIPLLVGGATACPAGVLDLAGDPALGLQAAASGPGPFTYDVSVTIDGVEHRASATWPDDVDDTCRPCVPLTFSPPLPGEAD